MSPIQKAIADVKFKIPLPILQEAFIASEFGSRSILPITLDAMIREKVIDARVAMDVNLTGGTQVTIPLDGCPSEWIDSNNIVYRVPKTLTEGRRISRVYSVALAGALGGGSLMGSSTSELWDAAKQVLNATADIPQVSSARVRLVGENTILLTESNGFVSNTFVRAYVEHDNDFSQFNPTTYPAFSKLVELATKAYIYTNLLIPMGESKISGGFELGRFREIVDSYADANEMYDTYFDETWRRVAIMDDARSHQRHISLLIGGAR
jgi:hypothetical protein